jgi:class 3 adenylate cyclase/predicted ATPase
MTPARVRVMDLGSWLRSLGLAQYEAAFRENAINEAILPKLTAEDLKDIGVAAVGHRRVLLDAIAVLRGETSPNQDNAASAGTGPADKTNRVGGGLPEAERRQLTVMFCDLVGSTELSARLDPEDMRAVIGAYHRCCAELIERSGGFVAKYMGDGVLAYFGYPQAHEHDAERAVRAGLALVEAVPKLKIAAAASLAVRVGIATGLVVVGDLIGSGEAQERGIVGETPNVAARLQGIAEPNMVVIAESTRRLLGNLFELRDLEARNLKGIAGPSRAWAALRSSYVESRFEALHATDLTALVGREEEVELLLRRWSRAKTGEGQVVLLSGEAGIGKSRLTAALLERLAAEPHTRLRYFCSPQHTDSVLYPIVGQMERAAELAHDDQPQVRLDKLDALFAQTSTSIADVALFAEMLSTPSDGRYPTLELAPQQRRQRTLDALIVQLEALARSNPVLMIFEDAHWIDPTSLELFARVVDRIQTLRVLLIMTFRPEFNPPWIGQPHVATITINRLTRHEVGAMIDHVVGNKLLPTSIRQDIIERTDGIPLFVEEMTKAVLEAESEGGAQQTVAAVPSPALAVPASLHASLMARLDRLGSAKEVAQIGAAIGREFSHTLLASVARKPGAELASALNRVVEAGLLFRQGVAPHATYLFKHALVQDAAYGTLLREPRRALHARIAETLERQFAEIAESHPELVAHHCTEAGLIEKAAGLWAKAGRHSLARSALAEAALQLTRALAQIAALPTTATLRREQMKLQVALANALMHTKGFAAPDTKAAIEQASLYIEQAETLGEPPEDPLLLLSVLYGFWAASFVAFKGDVVRDLAAQFLAIAERQAVTVSLMQGHRLIGISLICTGDIAEGQAHLDRAIALYDPAEHRPLATRFGFDSGVSILIWRSLSLWILGHPDAALESVNEALKEARKIGQATTLMFALTYTSLAYIWCGDYAAANAQTDELIALTDEKGAVFWKVAATILEGIMAVTDKAPTAVNMIASGITAWRSTGSTALMPLWLSYLAQAHAKLGGLDDAWRCIGEATTAVENTKEKWYGAEVHRIAGEIALMASESDADKAEVHFRRSLEIARAQQARSWELRAAMSMARLWRDQGKRHQAHDLLAPVYDWFTEGFDTADLKEAKGLVDELAS